MARKAILTLCIILLSATALWAAERGVVFEFHSGTNCGYCPRAEYAMDRIYKEQGPDKFVPMVWYNRSGSMYVTAEALERRTYYGVDAHPYVFFDGVLPHRGAYPEEQNYQWYMTSFNTRIALNAPVAITFLQKQYADGKVMVKVKVDIEENLSAGHVCHIVLWEDEVDGHYRFVERAATTKDLTITAQGQSEEFEHEFTISGWNEAKLGLSVFVQEPVSKEVKNGRAGMLESAYAVEPTSVGRVKALYR